MLNLSDTEKPEIIRFIEAVRPLPDKYRFPLFGDKHEVELVWNGTAGEVCNIVGGPAQDLRLWWDHAVRLAA